MSEPVAELSAITDQLSGIKLLLIAILVAVIVSACVNILRFAAVICKSFRTIWDDFFRDEAKRLLESDNVSELVLLAKDKLKKRPNNVYAHWYLGRAYYIQEKWLEARAAFQEVARVDPSWIDEHVNPYMKAIEGKIGPETIH